MVQMKSESVSLYVVEEQEIYRDIYSYILPTRANIDLLRVSANGETGNMTRAVSELCPDVLLLSIKKLDVDIIEELEQIRNNYPQLGIVILLVFYSSQDIELLRRLANSYFRFRHSKSPVYNVFCHLANCRILILTPQPSDCNGCYPPIRPRDYLTSA